ncbi:MAG: sugar-binding domain-containing protein, partial [Candidatus Ratteibacteria bacterium]
KIGGNWTKIRTKTLSWSDQGLRYYKGDTWYRSSVVIPEKFKDKKIFLWFGGVDELAKVWLNGNEVGTSPGKAFVPFEFDVTNSVNWGRENFVAVKITNKILNELGTGGITAPVMFYAQQE